MKKVILFLVLILLFSCQKDLGNPFPIVNDFIENKSQYKIDTMDLENISNEGGEVIVYFNKDNKKTILDFYVYGETGKLNYMYFTEKKFKYQFVVKKEYKYDKPITEKDLKIDSVINYIDFQTNPKLFDQNGNRINDTKKLKSTISKVDSFFKQTLKNNVVIGK
jgi:hypothetical protein